MEHTLSALKRTSHWTRRSRNRGAVMVEAVIILPVLITLFFGVTFAAKLRQSRQVALNRARTCAWIYSNKGCVSAQLPGYCRASKSPAPNRAADIRDGHMARSESAEEAKTVSILKDLKGNEPTSVFSEDGTARSQVPLGNHSMFVPEGSAVSASYHLPCNLPGETSDSKLINAWNVLGPKL